VSSATGETEAHTAGPATSFGWRPAEVVERVTESPSASTLILEADGFPPHRAGQHLDVRLTAEDGYQAERSYSIASGPEDARLAITAVRFDDGEVSPWLVDDAQPGDAFEVRGPIGGWFVWEAPLGGPLLLVGGGSGLVPLRSMLRHRAAARSTVPTRLILSARSEEDLLYKDDLEPGEGLDVFISLTRSAPADWKGRRGRVDREMLGELAFAPEERPAVFVCGPTAFVESVAENLIALGHEPARVKTERFGPTGG
jgi:ferredoxin-NADP reductase